MLQTFEEEEEKIGEIIAKADLPEGGLILDIGTGMGWMAASLAKSDYKVVTIEENMEFQVGAKELVRRLGVEENIEFKVGSVTSLSFDNESFDGVVSYLILHHTADIERTIEKMFELCRRGGKILIVELSKAGMEMVSKYHANHINKLVDPSPALKQKNVDFQAFTGELTNVYVCQKKL